MVLCKKRITKALIRLCGCAGWSAPVLFANPRRHVFSRRAPYDINLKVRKSDLLHSNNKGADQPAHLRSLISAFIIHSVEFNCWSCYMPNFNILASLCSWEGWIESYPVENPEGRFSCVKANIFHVTGFGMPLKSFLHSYKGADQPALLPSLISTFVFGSH